MRASFRANETREKKRLVCILNLPFARISDSALVDDENSTRKCANDYKRPEGQLYPCRNGAIDGIKSRDSTRSYIPGSLNVHPPRETLEIRPEDALINYSRGENLRVYGKAWAATLARPAYPLPLSFAVARIPCGHKARIDYQSKSPRSNLNDPDKPISPEFLRAAGSKEPNPRKL